MLCALHIINIAWNFKKIGNMLEILPSYISSAFIYCNIFTHFSGIIFHNLHLIIYGHQCRKFLFSNLLEDHPHNDYLSHSIFSTMICPCSDFFFFFWESHPCSDLLRFNPTLLLIYFICTFNIYYKVISIDWSA